MKKSLLLWLCVGALSSFSGAPVRGAWLLSSVRDSYRYAADATRNFFGACEHEAWLRAYDQFSERRLHNRLIYLCSSTSVFNVATTCMIVDTISTQCINRFMNPSERAKNIIPLRYSLGVLGALLGQLFFTSAHLMDCYTHLPAAQPLSRLHKWGYATLYATSHLLDETEVHQASKYIRDEQLTRADERLTRANERLTRANESIEVAARISGVQQTALEYTQAECAALKYEKARVEENLRRLEERLRLSEGLVRDLIGQNNPI